MGAHGTYYIPKPSHWPLVGSIGLTTTLVGAACWLHHDWYGPYVFIAGLCILVAMMFGWFGQVIYETAKAYMICKLIVHFAGVCAGSYFLKYAFSELFSEPCFLQDIGQFLFWVVRCILLLITPYGLSSKQFGLC